MLQKFLSHPVIEKIREFQHTPWYIACVAALMFLSHVLGLEYIVYWLVGAIAIFTLIINDDTTPFIPLVFFPVFAISRKNGATGPESYGMLTSTAFIVNCVVIISLAVGALIFNIIYYKKARKFLNRTFLGSGLTALALGFVTNGLFSKGYNILSLPMGLSFAALYFGIYLIFFHTLKWKKGYSMRYLAFVFFTMGLLIAAELGVLYMTEPALHAGGDVKNLVWLGWSLSNAIAFIFMLTIPFGFYLVWHEKYSLVYFIGTFLMLIAVVFTYSRASLIIALPLFVGGTIFSCLFAKSKKQLWVGAGVLLVAAIVFIIVKHEWLLSKMTFYIENGLTNDRGRFELWEQCIDGFIEAPIFGKGLMFESGQELTYFFWAHNTPLQFLVTGGIVGLGTYLFHRVQTGILFIKKPTLERMFAGIAVLCLLVNSLLDGAMSCQHMIIYYAVILAFSEKDLLFKTGKIDENGEPITPPPTAETTDPLEETTTTTDDADEPAFNTAGPKLQPATEPAVAENENAPLSETQEKPKKP